MRTIYFLYLFALLHPPTFTNSSNIATNAMITSATPQATKIGIQILKSGGNAADATVAVAFALSVTEPYSAGIGGGGFLLYRDNKTNKIHSLDFRERAPSGANKNMFQQKNTSSTQGPLAVAIPHTVQGLWEFHQKFGSKPWAELLKPAIQLAQNGFPASYLLVQKIQKKQEILKKYPATKKIFFPNNKNLKIGQILIQKDLANTLRRIAQDYRDFYTGKTAQILVAELQKHGGIINKKDLALRKVTWRDPVCTKFLGTRVCSMGPPSSGGIILCQILQILEQLKFHHEPWHSVKSLHLLAEAMKITYAERASLLGDPDFVKIPINKLLSKKYITQKIKQINLTKATRSKKINQINNPESQAILKNYESKQTTHFNIVDKNKNSVALTFTINANFGSGIIANNTGIILNNQMDDFATSLGKPNIYGLVGGKANQIAPRKIPLSSMTPIIADKNNKLIFVAGSPGGSTIITTGVQMALNLLVYNMTASQAVSKRRIHMQWLPDTLFAEERALDPTTQNLLTQKGHIIKINPTWGNASIINIKSDKLIEGATDPRGVGLALGLSNIVPKKILQQPRLELRR